MTEHHLQFDYVSSGPSFRGARFPKEAIPPSNREDGFFRANNFKRIAYPQRMRRVNRCSSKSLVRIQIRLVFCVPPGGAAKRPEPEKCPGDALNGFRSLAAIDASCCQGCVGSIPAARSDSGKAGFPARETGLFYALTWT